MPCNRSTCRRPRGAWSRFGIALSLSALSLAGCGGGGNVSRPKGQIVDGGAPVARAMIAFSVEIDDREIRLSGLTDAEGEYRLDYGIYEGLPLGPAEVTIERALLRDGSSPPPGEEGAYMLQTGEATLQTYEYEVELTPGSQRLDFDLSEEDDGAPR